MVFFRGVLVGFHGTQADERSADEAQTHRFEWLRRERLRCIAGPEAVPVARHDREARDLRVADEIVNLAALDVSAAVIASADDRITARPRLRKARRQILRVDSPVERAQRIAPDLPGRRRLAELLLQPLLLISAEDGLRRRLSLWIRNTNLAELDLGRWLATVERTSAVK